MLRINLLPDYIGDKNKIRNLGIGWAVIVAALAVVLLMVNSTAARNLQAAKDDRTEKERLKGITDGNKKAKTDEEAARAIIESKQTFVMTSKLYNDGWADVFETIRDVKPSDNSIILDSMSVDTAARKTVNLTGFGTSELGIVRWWMSLRNNTALFDHVNFDLVPHAYTPASASADTGMGGVLSQMGGPGSGGMGGGKKGNLSPMGMGGMGSGGMGGPGMGGPGMGGGGGQATAGNGPGELQGKHGINFTAAVVLKTALAGGIPTPTWPSGGGGAAQGGGMQMMGGPGSGGAPPMSGGGGARGGA